MAISDDVIRPARRVRESQPVPALARRRLGEPKLSDRIYLNARIREMKAKTPNPAGRHGKPIILPPMKFEDSLSGNP